MASSTGLNALGSEPPLTLALVYLRLQRASRSFCRILAGLSCQCSGIRPSLIAAFSSSVPPLFRRRHDRGVDDPAAHREIVLVGQRRIEASEEPVDRLGLHQAFA